VTGAGAGTASAGDGSVLDDLLRKMHSSLVSQIKSVLNHLQVCQLVMSLRLNSRSLLLVDEARMFW